jgi:hypothetical protein
VNHRKLHAILLVVWVLLAIPTMLVWKESVLWVAMMSLYANVAGHWAAYEAAKEPKGAKD